MQTQQTYFKMGAHVRSLTKVIGDDHCGDEHTLPAGALGVVDDVTQCGTITVAYLAGKAADGDWAVIISVYDRNETCLIEPVAS